MPAAAKLTKKYLDKVAAPERGETWYRDNRPLGFCLRVRASGSKTYYFEYKRQGHKRRVPLGDYHALTLEQARKMAQGYKATVVAGGDPAEDRKRQLNAPTVAELVEYFFAHEVAQRAGSTVKAYRRQADRFVLPAMGRKKVEDVRRSDVQALMRKLSSTPVQANRVLAFVKRLFTVAENQEVCTRNPCRGVAQYPEESRERYLSEDEAARLTQALEAESNRDAANAYALLLLTGARSTEVRTARWDMFDFAAGRWTKPSGHTKQRKTHHYALGHEALALLGRMFEDRNPASPYLFPSPESPDKPRYDFKKPWDRIRARAGLEDVRAHDLRHTFASYAISSGASLAMVGALLGHTQAQTTLRYAHLQQDPLRRISDQVGAQFARLAEGRDKADVVAIPTDHTKAANDG